MNHSDEELQSRAEKGSHKPESADEKTYQRIFSVLEREPYQLPTDFADKIVRKVEAQKSGLFGDYFWFGLGLFAFLITAVVVLVWSDFKPGLGSSTFIADYWGLVAFGAVFIFCIHLADRQLLRTGAGNVS